MHKINAGHYLVAEGISEYGHMATYARVFFIWHKFEGYENNQF